MIDAGSSAALVAERSRKKADRLRRSSPSADDLGRAERLDRFAEAWQQGADGENLDGEAGGILVVSAEKLCSRIQQLPRTLTEQEVAAISAVIRRKWLTARVMTNKRVDVPRASTAPPTVVRVGLLQRIIRRFAAKRPR
jgi:hypothetical protein